jgi:hypothetical protein
MQSTPPLLPMKQRPTAELIEDLCLSLRDVGVWTWSLPNEERAVSKVKNVQEIYALLNQRNADVRPRIKRLSEETSWQMEMLLQECLAFPNVIPYVRDLDGVRRSFRCSICQKCEFPDREGIFLCDVCLTQAKDSFETKSAMNGLLLLRLYNESYWCRHADSETVLMAFDDYGTLENTWCEKCVFEEKVRRAAIVSLPS